jgi:hypothetical protein
VVVAWVWVDGYYGSTTLASLEDDGRVGKIEGIFNIPKMSDCFIVVMIRPCLSSNAILEIVRFENLLIDYLHSGKAYELRLPNVAYCADQLHLSPNYFGDLIKKETGSTQLKIFLSITHPNLVSKNGE